MILLVCNIFRCETFHNGDRVMRSIHVHIHNNTVLQRFVGQKVTFRCTRIHRCNFAWNRFRRGTNQLQQRLLDSSDNYRLSRSKCKTSIEGLHAGVHCTVRYTKVLRNSCEIIPLRSRFAWSLEKIPFNDEFNKSLGRFSSSAEDQAYRHAWLEKYQVANNPVLVKG